MEDHGEVLGRFGAQRHTIQRISFTVPRDGLEPGDLSLLSGLCIGQIGNPSIRGTGLPGPGDIEVEIHIKVAEQESE
jgi:hypothetical protein